jgi:hypothetical protein
MIDFIYGRDGLCAVPFFFPNLGETVNGER